MECDPKTALQLLQRELEFLNSGGYRSGKHSPWRPAYIFEDSPSCPNIADRARPHPCEDCWLMEFVSPELRSEQVPCRFVPLTASGVTVDSLYRYGTQAESEEMLRTWVHQRIRELEKQIRETGDLKLP